MGNSSSSQRADCLQRRLHDWGDGETQMGDGRVQSSAPHSVPDASSNIGPVIPYPSPDEKADLSGHIFSSRERIRS